ncbi:MAG: alpha-L-arabinofuranosidase C-terminal domain-containing protein [Chloroflexota bacterium]
MTSSESAGPLSASIWVDRAKIIGAVHPHIFGHVIEHLEDCIYNGLWAEVLQNRKMAGHDTTYYGVVAGWKPVGTDAVRMHRRPYRGDDESAHYAGPVAFAHDNTRYYVAGDFGRGQSQRIDNRRAMDRACGIGQDRLGIRAGQRYTGYAVLRASAITRVTIALGNQTSEIEGIGDEWRRFPFAFVPDSTMDDALFSITTAQPGTLWIGLVSLMPDDNQTGWRHDVCELARALKPPIIRYPGGNFASAYHWLDGIGERDRRPVRLDRAWQAFEPNDVGTDEFMTLCLLLDAEPYLCVNMGDGTPEEAAAWVEYCNGSASSHYGGLRAANGRPEPYNVIYWGLGNEVYGNWQVGHVDAETYAHDCVKWARAMRAADPAGHRLKLLAVGATPDFWPEWNEAVARIAGEHIDYITLHHYAQADEDASRDDQYWLAVTAPSRIGDLIAMSRATIDAHAPGGKRIPISFDEWNVIHRHAKYPRVIANGDWSALEHQALFTTLGEQMGVAHQDYALVDGLYAALFFNVLLRNADHVTMANQAQLVNLFGLIETGPAGAYGTAEYHAFRLYVEQSGPTAVAVRVDSPTFEVRATGNLPARQGEPYLDVAATQDIERRKLWLHVVNRHPREEIAVRIDVGAGITEAVHHLLGGRGPWTRNSFTDPEAIAVSSTHLDWVGAGPLTFPACSASSLELTLAEP